jgi:hypothetical protein
MLKKGTIVSILPEYQDPGDNNFVWMTIDDEEKGRISIAPVNIGLPLIPTSTVQASWLRPKFPLFPLSGDA